MQLFQNKMKEQINQSIVHHWLRLFPISQAIFESHFEKMMPFEAIHESIYFLTSS